MPSLLAIALALQAAPATTRPDQDWHLSASRPCSAAQIAALTQAPDAADTPYRLTCRARLNGADVTRRVLFEGAESSGAGIDCGGGAIGVPGARTTTQTPTVAIWSRRIDGSSPAWSRPTDIVLSHCVINGAVRVWGMGVGGRIDDLRNSSRTADHTAAAQAAAPSHVRLDQVTIRATGSIPLYVGPGVTALTMQGGAIEGRSDAVAVYLDAESADNVLRDVTFDIATSREQVAIDGSARNVLRGNRFALAGQGGVFLYRNCGEDGVIRHQTPSGNRVSDNRFSGAARFNPRTVVVGAREGRRSYCAADRGWPFGSSLDDGDHAAGNIVERNATVR